MTDTSSELPNQQPVETDENLFGASSEVRSQVEEALEAGNAKALQELIQPLHAADVADVIYHLDANQRSDFITAIKPVFKPDILAEVEDSVRQEIFRTLDIQTLVHIISSVESDDAVSIIEDLDDERKNDVLQSIPSTERAIFERYLTYPEKSAGRLMQREIVCAPPFWTVSDVLSFVRQTKKLPRSFYEIYIVDPRHHPLGKISLNQLLRSKEDAPLEEMMDTNLHVIPVQTDQEDVARSFDHYGLISAPVVNEEGRIVGMITVDDAVDVIEQEAEEDILHMAGVSAETDFYSPTTKTAYWRIRWLAITILNTLIASFVISRFEASIQQITALAFLMTINAAMGGNSGMQVVTVVVRALATRDLLEEDAWRAVRKEIGVGLLVGGFCALTLGVFVSFWQNDVRLGIVLACALTGNMLWASFAGTLLPIVIQRLGMDPAISAGPILTTTTDVLGYSIFLGLATVFLL